MADIQAKDNEGRTALHDAARAGSAEATFVHPDTISAISNLAYTLGNEGKLEETAAMQKAHEVMVKLLGKKGVGQDFRNAEHRPLLLFFGKGKGNHVVNLQYAYVLFIRPFYTACRYMLSLI